MRFIPVVLVALLALPLSALSEELEGENLLQKVPDGYKIDFTAKQKTLLVAEMVPVGESVKNWTEMLTVQVFEGLRSTTPEKYQARMESLWAKGCTGASSEPMTNAAQNGYAYSVWMQSCPNNTATGKMETTLFKAIKGSDSFYVIQKAFKFKPSKKQVTKWRSYLASVSVCDSRLVDRACQLDEMK